MTESQFAIEYDNLFFYNIIRSKVNKNDYGFIATFRI